MGPDVDDVLCDEHISSDSNWELSDCTSSCCNDSDSTNISEFILSDDDMLLQKESQHDSLEEKHLAILSYMLKYNLNGEASKDLTELISNLSEENSSLKGIALSQIKAAVETSDIQRRDFCDNCFSLFPVDDSVFKCVQSNCTGLRYKVNVSDQQRKQRKSFFTSLPIAQQVKDILERSGIWTSIQDYKTAKRRGITDITTGTLYKHLCEDGGFLSQSENITFLFNTDGIPLYKSSSISIWPVYLVINELPPKMRFSKKNMIMWGVWQAKGKPVFHTFLQPFLEEMQMLKDEGLAVVVGGNEIHTKAMLIAGTMDLQAKAYIVDMTQHNGHFGCFTCEHPGEVVAQGRGHARVYPPTDNPLRTNEGIVQNGKEASESGKTVKGIKGVSPMMGLEWFDLVSGMGPDYMHGVLLGVTKKLLQLLFSAPHSKKPFSLASSIQSIDRRLKRMMPTDDISRLPRALENNIPHLKASELQNWLLFYSVPSLIGYMPSKYLDHLALFVEGIYILLGDSITETQMERAEVALSTFYNQFSDLYGKNNCTLNLHNACCHLPMYVRMLGPLWAWSCFPFENMNGSILDSVHGTGDVSLQILWVVQAQKRLAIDSRHVNDQTLKCFINRMTSTKRSINITGVAGNCEIVGGLVSGDVGMPVKLQVEALLSEDAGKLMIASRIFVKDTVFYSKAYGRHTKRTCHFALVSVDGGNKVARIEKFLYHQKQDVCLAVIDELSLETDEPLVHPLISHMMRINLRQNSEVRVVMADKLLEKVLCLEGNKTFSYISRLPNLHGLCS